VIQTDSLIMNKFVCLGLLIMLSMSVYCESPVESKTPETELPKTESSVIDTEKSPKSEVPSAAETPKSEVPIAKELPVPAEPTKPALETPKSEAPVAKEAPVETAKPENTTPTVTPVTPQPSVAHKVQQVGSNLAYFCGVFVFLTIALVGAIISLSKFYKYRVNSPPLKKIS
jgi:hypothetical protein